MNENAGAPEAQLEQKKPRLEEPLKKDHHECTPACLHGKGSGSGSAAILSRLPLFKRPIALGFKRYLFEYTARFKQVKVRYKAPCGKRFTDIRLLEDFLKRTRAQLTIDCFSFEPKEIKFPSRMMFGAPCLYDISDGKEKIPISCVNDLDDVVPDANRTYVTERRFDRGIPRDGSEEFLVCCSCEDLCASRFRCECQRLTESHADDNSQDFDFEEMYSYRRLREKIDTGLYECNPKCKCSKSCYNRVAQNPVSVELQLFRTLPLQKGWGVRCLHDLPKGTFICRYDGLIVSDRVGDELGKRTGDAYLLDLDFIEMNEKEGYEENVRLHDSAPVFDGPSSLALMGSTDDGPFSQGELDIRGSVGTPRKLRFKVFGETGPYVIGANGVGNIGRYFNHSCDPNMFVQNVFIESHDPRFPHIAFFTSKFIPAGEELTWDYKYSVGSVKGKSKDCLCGTWNCSKRLL